MSELDARAASLAARALFAPLCEVVEADLADDPQALADALARVDRTRPTCVGFSEPCTVLGEMAWIFDDDGQLGETEPAPLLEVMTQTLGYQSVERVHAVVHGSIEPVAERLGWFGLFDRLTHVVSAGAALRGPAPSGLLSVTGRASQVGAWLGDTVEAVTFVGTTDLDRLGTLPRLRHLGLWYAEPHDVVALLDHPVLSQLEVLDLFAIETRSFPFPEVLARRERLGHLRRLCLPGHGASKTLRAALENWPRVWLTSYDRREVLGQDLRVLGFPRGER